MNVNEDALKAAYRRYLQGLWPATRRNCPPTAELLRFFSDDSPRRLKARVLDHVAGCGACAEEFEILMALDRRSRALSADVARLRTGASTGKKKRTSRGFLGAGRWLLAGAGLAAAVLILWFHPPGALFHRSEAGPLRSAAIDAGLIPEAPRGRVDASNSLEFRWRFEHNEDAGAACVVSLYDDSLLEIWRSRKLRSLSCALPREVRESLIPGRTYFWGVSVAPGKGRLESELAPFSVKRRPPS